MQTAVSKLGYHHNHLSTVPRVLCCKRPLLAVTSWGPYLGYVCTVSKNRKQDGVALRGLGTQGIHQSLQRLQHLHEAQPALSLVCCTAPGGKLYQVSLCMLLACIGPLSGLLASRVAYASPRNNGMRQSSL